MECYNNVCYYNSTLVSERKDVLTIVFIHKLLFLLVRTHFCLIKNTCLLRTMMLLHFCAFFRLQ